MTNNGPQMVINHHSSNEHFELKLANRHSAEDNKLDWTR